jgi:hypothetical protein
MKIGTYHITPLSFSIHSDRVCCIHVEVGAGQSSDYSIIGEFWSGLVRAFATEFEAATKASLFLKNVFINEFPRLHACLVRYFD